MPSIALGSGLAVSDKSVSNLGRAFAGGAAIPEDASTLYNNPAGMQWIAPTLSVGAHYIDPDIKFKSSDGTTTSAGDGKLLPNIYYVGALGEHSRVGFGLYAPFGLGLKYPSDWEGRYHSTESDLRTLNLTAGVSSQLTPQVAFGATVDAQYLDADLNSAVDFGAFWGDSGAADGSHRLTGDNWSWGYSLGILASLTPATTLGVAYHSSVRHKIKGDSEFDGVPAPLAGMFTDSGGKVSIEMPQELSIGLAHAFSDALTVALDYTWTGWSVYDELRLQFDNDLPDSVEPQEWKDSYRTGIGANYRLNPTWLLRAGYSIDRTPIPSAEYRTPRVPDSDRNWLAMGFNYAPNKTVSFDFSYAYVTADDAPVKLVRKDPDTQEDVVFEGTFDNKFQYISAQLNWHF